MSESVFLFLRWQIAAVCDFYTYIRYIAQGLVKSAGKSQTLFVMEVQKLLRNPSTLFLKLYLIKHHK